MNHRLLPPRAILPFLLLLLLIWAAMAMSFSEYSTLAMVSPLADPTPTCPAPPAGCPQSRVYGYQPQRYNMRLAFNKAANNTLGNGGPTYSQINRFLPPNTIQENVSDWRPIPHIILRGVAWQEAHWLQFANSVGDSDNTYACTLVSSDCGYGLMQITSCMNNGCGWFTPIRASGELTYNLGTGTNFLIQKWNAAPFVGDNDHTSAEQWYYAVTAYNGWSSSNDPNNSAFDPRRPPYGEGNYMNFSYPYQERVWGWMARSGRLTVAMAAHSSCCCPTGCLWPWDRLAAAVSDTQASLSSTSGYPSRWWHRPFHCAAECYNPNLGGGHSVLQYRSHIQPAMVRFFIQPTLVSLALYSPQC